MKKIFRPENLPLLVLPAGVVGFLLRLWTLGAGPDWQGLYTPQPVAWTLLGLLAALVAVVTVVLSRRLPQLKTYAKAFPASKVGAAGIMPAAVAIMMAGLSGLRSYGDNLSLIIAVLGVAAGIAMVTAAYARLSGQRPGILSHIILCLFFAGRLFSNCRDWSNDPNTVSFVIPFFASVCTMLAVYQLTRFSADIGNRRHSLLWSLMAIFFCTAALVNTADRFFHVSILLWLATNLCSCDSTVEEDPEEAPAEEEPTEEPTEEAPAHQPEEL